MAGDISKQTQTLSETKSAAVLVARSQTVGGGLIPNSSLFCNLFSKPISHESIMFTGKKGFQIQPM